MPKIRVRREKFVQAYCPRDAPMVSAPICIRCLDFFASDFSLATKFEVVCSLMVNPSICGDICHTDFISAKTHVPCDPSFTDAECTRWANLMKKTEKFTDDDYNRTVTKIMDTVPNETVEENFIFIENVTLPDSYNFTIEESKSSIEEEMICLDQFYHQPNTTIGSFENFFAERCQLNTASMNTASFIIIILVCSLLTGVVVFAVLNLLWKKFRSRRYEGSRTRTAPRTARDEELYTAGQKT